MIIKKTENIMVCTINPQEKIEVSALNDGKGIKIMHAKTDAGNTIRTLVGAITPNENESLKVTFLSWNLQNSAVVIPSEKAYTPKEEIFISSCANISLFAELIESKKEVQINVGTSKFHEHLAVCFSIDKEGKKGPKILPEGEIIESTVPFTHIEILRKD